MPPLSPTPPPPHLGRRQLLASAIATLLSACGGGGADGGTQTAGVSTGGTGSVGGGKPATVSGRVSAQGLRVNDVAIDLDANTVITNEANERLTAADLKPGTTVVVDGGTVTGSGSALRTVAQRIQVRSLIVGPVQAVNVAQRSLRVMDHTVVLSSDATLDAAWAQGLASIQPNDVIEVYGWQDVAGQRVVASRMAVVTQAPAYKVTGVLADLQLNPGQCRVGTQLIAYGWPTSSTTAPANGQWVQGSLYTLPKTTEGRWTAIQMDATPDWLSNQDQISLEGLITVAGDPAQLGVQGWRVDARNAACHANGRALGTCAALQAGQAVRVIGRIEAGTVIASAIYSL